MVRCQARRERRTKALHLVAGRPVQDRELWARLNEIFMLPKGFGAHDVRELSTPLRRQSPGEQRYLRHATANRRRTPGRETSLTLIEDDQLDRDQCLSLLARVNVGRLGMVRGPLPFIYPVRYSVSRGHILFGVSFEELAREIDDIVVALQADGFDEDSTRYWTVVAIGPTTPVGMTWEGPSELLPEKRYTFRLRPKMFSCHWLNQAGASALTDGGWMVDHEIASLLGARRVTTSGIRPAACGRAHRSALSGRSTRICNPSFSM